SLVVLVGIGMPRAELDADERARASLGADPGGPRGVDEGGMATREAFGPAENRDLDSIRGESEVEAEGCYESPRPRARHGHHHGSGDAAARGLHAGHAPALRYDSERLAVRLHGGAEAPRRLREGESGGGGIGEARPGLPRRAPHVVHAHAGDEVSELLPRHEARVDAEALLHGHVGGERLGVSGTYDLHDA